MTSTITLPQMSLRYIKGLDWYFHHGYRPPERFPSEQLIETEIYKSPDRTPVIPNEGNDEL
jgi:hypothetical protein